MTLEEGVELSRFTTLGSGGPARAFARPESVAEVEELLRWATEREVSVATVGLGSNLLVADEGEDGPVVVGVDVHVEHARVRGERGADRVDDRAVAAFGEVRDAL